MRVTYHNHLCFFENGVYDLHGRKVNEDFLNSLAKSDGIEPPTAEGLKEVLKKLNGPDWEGWYEIIRWDPIEEVEA